MVFAEERIKRLSMLINKDISWVESDCKVLESLDYKTLQLTTSLLKFKGDKDMTIQDQPAYIIKMRAKPGSGDKLFELATIGMYKSGASDRFIILREDDDPDVLWNIEVFRSIEAKEGYETSALADELRDEIIDLLAEPPIMRVSVHPYSALPLDL